MFGKLQKIIINIILIYFIVKMSDQSDISTPKQKKLAVQVKAPQQKQTDKQIQLLEQNKNLRRKLKQLSARLDDQLQKAARNKLKANLNYVSTSTAESQSLQLQNAYKMIQRLQKTVKDFQSKQSYQISFKRILDLQSIIKKKQAELQQLKLQAKDTKKIIRDKQRHIQQLLSKQAVNPNLNQQKQQINKLKQMLKKMQMENQMLKKQELQKHKKLVSAERKLVEIQQEEEEQIGIPQEVLDQLEQYKNKYKEAMVRIQKQNVYITKLNSKLSVFEQNSSHKRVRSYHSSSDQNKISKSMQQLPDLSNKKVKPIILDHIPTLNIPTKMLRRY